MLLRHLVVVRDLLLLLVVVVVTNKGFLWNVGTIYGQVRARTKNAGQLQVVLKLTCKTEVARI